MRALLDVSMLLALADRLHVHHAKAEAWRASNVQHAWASCPLTQNGFVRIVSGRTYANSMHLPDAVVLMRQLTARPDHEFWPDDLSLFDPAHVDLSRLLSPRQSTDVYLLALAVAHGGRLVTLDTGISYQAARSATSEHLVVV